MFKILMCSSPGGNRGPANAFQNHTNALASSKDFMIKDWNELESESDLEQFDVFWFSVRFHPNLYYELKRRFPGKIYWMGPNVLFEKAEVGPSDEWEVWFTQNVKCDVYTNKADFYLDRVQQFFTGSQNYAVLKNCLNLESYQFSAENINSKKRDTDVLVYYKNRRIDNQLDDLFPKFIENLEKLNMSYDIIQYGNYSRDDYFRKLLNSKVCAWMSIEDFCSNAQLEAQYLNVPVIGTAYNNTDSYDQSLNIPAATMTEKDWILWNSDMPDMYSSRIEKYLNEDYDAANNRPREYVLKNYSYEAYAKQVKRILE